MSIHQVKKIVLDYTEALKDHAVKFDDVMLFGSYAKGKAGKESDIDVAVIVPDRGNEKKYFAIKVRLWNIAAQVDDRLEPVLLDRKDFRSRSTSLANAVQEHGISFL